jgi:hypothetical protein
VKEREYNFFINLGDMLGILGTGIALWKGEWLWAAIMAVLTARCWTSYLRRAQPSVQGGE